MDTSHQDLHVFLLESGAQVTVLSEGNIFRKKMSVDKKLNMCFTLDTSSSP
jgi:hypothetical protein